MKNRLIKLTAFIGLLFLVSCGGSSKKQVYKKSALDKLIVELMHESNYSIMLADMDYDESADKYKHKYTVLVEKPEVKVDSTLQATDVDVMEKPWVIVSDEDFNRYKDNLGMTIISKKDGVMSKTASPAGYDNYVGNKRYGSWHSNSSGGSFWVFYGQYRFLSDLLMGPRYHYPRSSWNDYDRNYRGRKTYTGSGKFGSNSSRNGSTTWGKRSSTFKSTVNSKVTKSASRSSARRSRSSSRYSRSSTRSRSGGFGK